MTTRWVRKGDCPPEVCQGRCCEHIGFWIGDNHQIAELARTKGIPVKEIKGQYNLEFPFGCPHLKEGLCSIYNEPHRPQLCADWPMEPANLINDPYCGYYFVAEED